MYNQVIVIIYDNLIFVPAPREENDSVARYYTFSLKKNIISFS